MQLDEWQTSSSEGEFAPFRFNYVSTHFSNITNLLAAY